jgi:EAL domain-containing protein (putative c-di-GMP-specific phosphodiesterase class I)/GGDEF domain-containing protein
MSLIRQMWTLMLGVILLAFVGSVLVSVVTARAYLEKQLELKNNDNAQALALTLTQHKPDEVMVELALAAQFDTGGYQSIRWRTPEGRVQFERMSVAAPLRAPEWFVQAAPIASRPGVAQLASGWTSLGSVEVVSQPSFAHDDLWDGAARTSAWMAMLGVLATLLGHLGVRRLRKPLDAVVEQAGALTERRFVVMPVPRTLELRKVAEAMNALVERLRDQFADEAEQLQQLRRQANCDPLTGLSHRRHFLARLDAALSVEDGWADGQLWLVRVLRLSDMNRLLGHGRTDERLQALSRMLLPEAGASGAAEAALGGRLNGTDFALLVRDAPLDGPGRLMAQLRQLMGAETGAALVLSAVGWRHGEPLGVVLARADAALARAEARGDFVVEQPVDSPPLTAGGEDDWRQQLQSALRQGRTQLMQFPVRGADGAMLHLECPLRIQLEAGGAFQPAAHWLPYAMRTQLTGQVDETAVAMALAAIDRDGQARGVNLSPLSLRDAGFVTRLRGRIRLAEDAARKLWVEVDEAALLHQATALQSLCQQLRPFGVKVGLEHAGHQITAATGLLEVGLDFIKLEASVVRDIGTDVARQTLVRGTVALLHRLDLAVYAEGVQNEADLVELWRCGLDGATGPGVRD